ncbi:MAG TPA: hypothetical protein GX686_00105 [Paracoccus sp.]|nr:hypothetical protein [Paracoccus sp. (in: a-proteobacteria)]
MAAHDKAESGAGKVPELAWLRRLVTALALVMMLGIAVVAATLWLRLSPSLPELPAAITLPQGETAAAVTFARDWTVVVTGAGTILLFDRGGRLRQSVTPDS